MVALVSSIIVTALIVGGILAYQKRRPADQVVTWGEAMLGSMIVFFSSSLCPYLLQVDSCHVSQEFIGTFLLPTVGTARRGADRMYPMR